MFWCEHGIRQFLSFRLWFDNFRVNCCQRRLTAGPEPGTVFDSKLCNRIIDTARLQTVPACYDFIRLSFFVVVFF